MSVRCPSGKLLWLIVVGMACLSFTGCSLFVMGQKMLFGEPLSTSEFKTFTRVDLTKGKHRLLIVCSTPSAVDSDISTLRIDLIDNVTRQLKREGVLVVDPDEVAAWMDDHGGLPDDPSELAEKFDVDYIAWIDVEEFNIHEENSSDLLRGRSRGFVKVFRVSKVDDQRMASSVFSKEYNTVYPPHAPISQVNHSPEIFRREFTYRVAEHLAHKFYDHRPGWDI